MLPELSIRQTIRKYLIDKGDSKGRGANLLPSNLSRSSSMEDIMINCDEMLCWSCVNIVHNIPVINHNNIRPDFAY